MTASACFDFAARSLCLLLGAFGGFLLAVGLAVDLDDLGAVDDAIDQGADARRTGEDLRPLGEGLVAGQHRRALQVPPADHLEEQVAVAAVVGQVADLVEDQELRPAVAPQPPRQRRG
jgi:hypothetical protein